MFLSLKNPKPVHHLTCPPSSFYQKNIRRPPYQKRRRLRPTPTTLSIRQDPQTLNKIDAPRPLQMSSSQEASIRRTILISLLKSEMDSKFLFLFRHIVHFNVTNHHIQSSIPDFQTTTYHRQFQCSISVR